MGAVSRAADEQLSQNALHDIDAAREPIDLSVDNQHADRTDHAAHRTDVGGDGGEHSVIDRPYQHPKRGTRDRVTRVTERRRASVGSLTAMQDNLVRQSQLITTWGPGAMIDLPDCSVIVSGLDDWSPLRRERVREPRLAAKLRRILEAPALDLFTPPHHEENAHEIAPVGARIFPTWFLVKDAQPSPRNPQWRMRRLVRWDQLHKRRFVGDDGSKRHVVPVRFVAACRRGHIDDLHWRKFVHPRGRACERPLWIEERGTSGDLIDTYGVCDCGAERSLYEAAAASAGALGRCSGARPWIGGYAREECDERSRLLVRTASNAYFAQTLSVISLPEADSVLAGRVAQHRERLDAADALGALANFRMIPELAAAFSDYDDEAVIAEYRRQHDGGTDEDVPVKDAEFGVLDCGRATVGEDDPRSALFAQTLDRSAWDSGADPLLSGIGRLVLVHRLREVAALLGFTRFEAISPDKDGEIDLDVQRAALAETVTWLPAIENRGEGVFVSFDADRVSQWAKRPAVQARGRRLANAWRAWAQTHGRGTDVHPGLGYVMLHSLAHMLMTSISLDCGYPASALRERVYAGEGRYGILIYTGSSDSEGTLGGLVEAGRRFADHLRRAVHASLLCSNDPVCAEDTPGTVNAGRAVHGAACHGCLLIAETSCEQRNDFLDRALVVPTVSTPDAAFFDVFATPSQPRRTANV